jgi:hypothetical protein
LPDSLPSANHTEVIRSDCLSCLYPEEITIAQKAYPQIQTIKAMKKPLLILILAALAVPAQGEVLIANRFNNNVLKSDATGLSGWAEFKNFGAVQVRNVASDGINVFVGTTDNAVFSYDATGTQTGTNNPGAGGSGRLLFSAGTAAFNGLVQTGNDNFARLFGPAPIGAPISATNVSWAPGSTGFVKTISSLDYLFIPGGGSNFRRFNVTTGTPALVGSTVNFTGQGAAFAQVSFATAPNGDQFFGGSIAAGTLGGVYLTTADFSSASGTVNATAGDQKLTFANAAASASDPGTSGVRDMAFDPYTATATGADFYILGSSGQNAVNYLYKYTYTYSTKVFAFVGSTTGGASTLAFNQGLQLAFTAPVSVTPPVWDTANSYPKADTPTSFGFTVRLKIDKAGSGFYVVVPAGDDAPDVSQVKDGLDAFSNTALKSGTVVLAANAENSVAVSGLAPSTSYDVYFVAQDLVPNVQAAVVMANVTTAAVAPALVIHESFNYTLASTNPDPDAGLNSGNSLPATNVGGSPSGTATGLRSNWGAGTEVVAGLTYSNAGGTLATSGNAAKITTSGFGGNPAVYRFMATDPHLALRVGAVNNGAFGADGQTLYFSVLGSTSDATLGAFKLSFKTGSDNQPLENTAMGWRFNNSASAGTLALNTPTFFVIKIDFAAGATDTMSLWVDPELGSPLGAADKVLLNQDFAGLNSIQVNPTVAGAMILDEFRMGTTAADVMPLAGATANFSTWASAFTNPVLSNTASTADPDNDGLTNAVEYALGLDPRFSSPSPGVYSGSTLTFTKGGEAKVNGDVTYQIETSTTLGVAPSPWTVDVTNVTNGADTIAIVFPSGPVRNFARLKVILAP